MNSGTRIRVLATALLLAAMAVCVMGRGAPVKGVVACSRADDDHGSATAYDCGYGGDGCYTCVHTTGGGSFTCYENADGTIGGCSPGDGGDGGPYVY